MATGDRKGFLTGANVSIPNPFPATGSVAVVVGDLVFAVIAQQTTLTVTAVTDNLGNTYSATNAGTDGGNVTGRAFFSRVTVAGTLTSVNAAVTAGTLDAAIRVPVFEGPFSVSPHDTTANPANTTADLTSPYPTPLTGTLAQANNLIVGWQCASGTGSTFAVTAPGTLDGQASASANANAIVGYRTVAATTSVQIVFTEVGDVPNANVLGTAAFKIAAAAKSRPVFRRPLRVWR